jgi:hypothetical protein
MDESMVDVLTDALKRAAEAHGVHEAEDLGGVYDEEWPRWYAEHMIRALRADGYELSRTDPA